MNRITAGIVAVGFANIIWGFTTPALKIALNEIPTFSAIFIRFAIASFLITPFFLSRPYSRLEKKDFVPLLFIVGLGITAHMAFFALGLDHSSVVSTSLILATVPIVDTIAAALFLSEKISLVHKFGIVLGLLGSFVLVTVPVFFETRGSFQPF